MRRKRKNKPIAEQKTEKIETLQEKKWFRLTLLNGMGFRFEAQDYQSAQDWSRQQIEILGIVYPKDIATLQEEK